MRFRPSRRQVLAASAATATAVAAGGALLAKRGTADGNPVIVAVGRGRLNTLSDLYFEGITLAAETVNAAGGLLGRPVELRFIEEPRFTNEATLARVVSDTLATAARIVDDDRVVAVVGHPSSTTAIAASGVYNRANKLFLATHASSLLLTAAQLPRVFAMLPNDRDATRLLARHAVRHGMRRFVIFSGETSYGQETAGFFAQAIAMEGGEILHQRMLDIEKRSVDSLLLFLLDNPLFALDTLDGILLAAGGAVENAAFILRARQLGITTPIFGTDAITSSTISVQAGAAMKDVFGVSPFDVKGSAPETQAFARAFRARFDTAPSPTAALGHDAVLLVAHAAASAKTLDAGKLADAIRVMRYGNPLHGATGSLVFNASGQATDNSLFVLRHDGTAFQTVAGYSHPSMTPLESVPDTDGPTTPSTLPPPTPTLNR
ncbi:ABC transporter substrate-binding protein [Azospirillum doebereinerae]|uniref:ABC transporter substrate-binding protein n=1 Tax=Azospirillum doebereinerae TaxID=92933 RepID=UPI001EE57E09|nr:ABC transporter substrate-binding protein [Azospirillum doebereinerae]MCG5241252.1 ABC transporter substrate-binding protein [Azospirillum doebereinerae]